MSGEIHNFDNKKRRRPKWKDDRSADKYYDSGDISAIRNQQTVSDSAHKVGEELQAKPTKLPGKDDRSADKYYKNMHKPPLTKQQIERGQKLGKEPVLNTRQTKKTQPVKEHSIISDFTINTSNEINDVLDLVVSQLQSGKTQIVIYIVQGDSKLLRRTRASLEMLVTKEIITEEQYHEVRLSYTIDEISKKELDDKLGVPQPKGEKVCDISNSKTIDPIDFLSGKIVDEDEEAEAKIMAGESTVQEVDTTNDVPNNSALESEEDDENDFLTPKSIPFGKLQGYSVVDSREVPITVPKETPKVSTLGNDIKATESMEGIGNTKNKKPGRKSDRGSR